jgi:hypothetical protein
VAGRQEVSCGGRGSLNFVGQMGHGWAECPRSGPHEHVSHLGEREAVWSGEDGPEASEKKRKKRKRTRPQGGLG